MWKQGNGLLMKDVARDSIIFVAFGWNIFVHKLLQEMDHFILSWGGANYQKEILAQDKATKKKKVAQKESHKRNIWSKSKQTLHDLTLEKKFLFRNFSHLSPPP